jgi:hypothetical protein
MEIAKQWQALRTRKIPDLSKMGITVGRDVHDPSLPLSVRRFPRDPKATLINYSE